MARQIVYIAGKYSSYKEDPVENASEVVNNISMARKVSVECAQAGIFHFCPHTHSSMMHIVCPDVPKEYWLQLDKAILTHCSAILLLPGWESSIGAVEELRFFREDLLCQNVFHYPNDFPRLIEWYRGL